MSEKFVNEEKILDFWKDNKIYEKVQNKNKNKKRYYFLDGPPYTSGNVHIGTAWNKALKDCILRYKRAKGLDVWDRAGYDMHGLPVESKVQKNLNLDRKEDVLKFGLGNFIKECRKLAEDNLELMNKDFIRLGTWMDFDNAYRSVSNEYIEGIWWLIKKAHEKNRLYQDYKPMHWDYKNQSALAKHELEYKTLPEKSVFLKFKIEDKENEFLLIWTTTPWTIAFNLGIMVNPDIDYVKVKVDNEYWILAKALAGPVIHTVFDKKFEIIEEFKGEDIKGLKYEHPLYDELKHHYDEIKSKSENAHTVLLSSEYVTTTAGTGLVHMAPGCGPEDYEVGHRNNIPIWNNLEEDGTYPNSMGKFSGWHARDDNNKFIEEFDKLGCLIASTDITHEYPFGQRSNMPVVFRATKQWFFKVEDLKEKLIKENNEIVWVPQAAYNAFNSWLENLRDNSISKQRYWGTPLPIWVNVEDEKDYIVIGSKKELEELSGRTYNDLHLPFIDDEPIKIENKTYKRISEVLDVWVDAGTASWNCLDFPSKENDFNELFPADFILEGKDQIRGWFNLLSIASMLGFEKKSFKNVYMHGFVQDALGRKMSKSLGNSILPDEVIEKYSADTLRYYMIGGSNPGLDINYNFDDMKTKNRNLMILWNLHNYLIDLCKTYDYVPKGEINFEPQTEEKLMLSKLNSRIKETTEAFEEYKLNEIPLIVEQIFLDLSREYIQNVREKIFESKENREMVIETIYHTMIQTLKLFTPVAPFICEQIYLNFKEKFNLDKESISLYEWPEFDEKLIDKELEESFDVINEIVQNALYAREKAKTGIRWPLNIMTIVTQDDNVKKIIEEFNEEIKSKINVRNIIVKEENLFKRKVKPNFKEINKDYKELVPKIIAKFASESSESILSKIKDKDEYVTKIDGDEIKLNINHIIIEEEIPENFQLTESKKWKLYLNKDVNEELIGEGFSREIIRRIQNIRKNLGLQKLDKINLNIQCSDKVKNYMSENIDLIKEKVGTNEIEFKEDLNDFEEFKIKDEKIKIFVKKI
ncbi:MAG: isoleucine--tRNA ligase [Candidatus Woesearchaeota archaeon]